ncbi:glycosyltransferase family 2 protein [Candidatus Daviesbacteria bacterium]|nr:glycosyltransferase family 2 protein [Candidatus Daviesbacteria bacterium]
MKVSVVIPTFNEEKAIADCLEALFKQTYKNLEIIVVNDGSTDKTLEILSKFKNENPKVKVLTQKHLGAGLARNLGAKNAEGEILVFVDADMTFDKKFISNLIKPILSKKAIGSFSKDEFVLNKTNIWSKCWNVNKNLPFNKMHPKNYPDEQAVFRAILKKEFLKVGGFDSIGYIDDYTLSKKLNAKAKVAKNAYFYHKNPETLKEVFTQARWIGKNEYKNRKIRNENLMRIISIIRYSLPFSLVNGFIKGIVYKLPFFIFFKLIYDFAVEVSLFRSFFKEHLYK